MSFPKEMQPAFTTEQARAEERDKKPVITLQSTPNPLPRTKIVRPSLQTARGYTGLVVSEYAYHKPAKKKARK